MNLVLESGFLTNDPKEFKNNVVALTLSVGRGKNKNGESLGYNYIPMKAFGSCGEYIVNKIRKGDFVTVEGRLNVDEYDGKQITEVIIQRIEPAKQYVQTGSYNSNGTYSSSVWSD